MTQKMKMRLAALGLLGCLIAVGLLEHPQDYEPMRPGPNAPVFVDWRTGEWRQP